MEKKKVTLLIDQDDVLAEYIKGVTEAYNKKYGTSIESTACNNWNLHTVFGEEVETVMHEPQLFRHLEPTVDAIEVFSRLYHSGLFEMYIVTAAQPCSVEAKHEWIKEYLPFFPEERVIVCRRKYMIKGDYLLDDGMHNIEDFAKAGGTPIVFERPHNKDAAGSYRRVTNWKAFEKMMMELCYPELMEDYFEEETLEVV